MEIIPNHNVCEDRIISNEMLLLTDESTRKAATLFWFSYYNLGLLQLIDCQKCVLTNVGTAIVAYIIDRIYCFVHGHTFESTYR